MGRFILVLVALFSLGAVDGPKPLGPSDREAYKDLRIAAYQALAAYQDAAKREVQAKLDEEHAQTELTKVNGQMTQMMHKFQIDSGASPELWCISPNLQWTPKQKDKACPSW